MNDTSYSKVKLNTELGSGFSRDLVQEFLNAFSIFDIEKIAELLPEDADYEGYSNKYGFLAEYKFLFEVINEFNPELNFPLMPLKGNCQHCLLKDICVNDRQVYCFVDYSANQYNVLSMVFEIDKEGNLSEMYQCDNSLPSYEALLEAKKREMGIVL